MSDSNIEGISQLENTLDGVSSGASILGQDLDNLRNEFSRISQSTSSFSMSFQRELSGAMRSVIVDGKNLSDTLKNLGISMADKAFNAAINPLLSSLSSSIGSMFAFADGGVIQHGNVKAFAHGGVVNSPSYFSLANGMGLAGEAGPEAIMPLKRGADGRLGVAGGEPSNPPMRVTFNISTPDVEGFKKSQSQIASQMRRMMHSSNNG